MKTVSAQEALYAAVIADILDDYGLRRQVMDPGIRPTVPDQIVAGPAFTILAAPVYAVPDQPYQLELEAVDAVAAGQIIAAAVGEANPCGFWGELLTHRALAKQAVGTLVDGFVRDSAATAALGFPVFSRGFSPLDSKGRAEVIAYNVVVECGGVTIAPGDYIFGDRDGVVVIPAHLTEEVLVKAAAKIKAEDQVRAELRAGRSVSEVFKKYGVL